jgi:phosphoribosylaminoimidazolecarboxamide formyltransferase/IMP cyclohydrolase
MSKELKDMYFNKNIGTFPDSFTVNNVKYIKKENLRYGTNPHQSASLYVKEEGEKIIGDYTLLKEGKNGLSQTNIEDINRAVAIIKFFKENACAVMKHLNPSGVSVMREGESLKTAYARTRDCDAQAAFGSTVVFNCKVDKETAVEIMQTIVENVAAPSFSDDALSVFNDFGTYKKNKHIRIIKIGDISLIPKYTDEPCGYDFKSLQDGSIILETPFISKIKNASDFLSPSSEDKEGNSISIENVPSKELSDDMLFGWYVCAGVRSNGVVIVKDGVTLAIGTGEQDRVGAVSQAIEKAKRKYKGPLLGLSGAVIASDGFFPFRDSIDAIAKEGIKGIVQPGGSVKDFEVIKACNEHGISMVFTGERCFAHH